MIHQAKNWGRHEGVAIFMRKPDGTIYMAIRNAKNRPYLGMWAAPGGSVEEGETELVAAVRELQEETALTIDVTRLFKLARTGPHLCPPEQMGSGTPYHMTYYGLELREHEMPTQTEPTKQGQWYARSYSSWILEHVLCPGSAEMIEKLHRTKVSP